MNRLVCIFLALLVICPPAIAAADAPSPEKGGVVLVLSGGGTKGFAHIGVLKTLEREGVPVVGIVGTSIGAIIGGLYSSGYSADEIRSIIDTTDIMGLLADSGKRLKPDAGDHRPVGESVSFFKKDFDKNFKVSGPKGVMRALSLVSFLAKYTGHIQTNDFNYLHIPFACIATDLATGEPVVLRSGNIASAIRASMSIPGLLEPLPFDGRLLVDGGLVANLPVEIARDIFPGHPIIAVNLSGPSIVRSNSSFTGVIDVMIQTIDIMTVDNIKHNESMADLVLFPDVKDFSILDSSGYDVIYQRGIDAAEANLDEINTISRNAPPAPARAAEDMAARVVRSVKVTGLNGRAAEYIEKSYASWIGRPYNVSDIDAAMDRIAKRDEVATVDVDTLPGSVNSGDVDVVFSVEKRPPFEIAFDGYTSSIHPHRWVAFEALARDLIREGDSANFEARLGNEEWGASLKYFTPMMRDRQWGFALNARNDEFTPRGMPEFSYDRYSLRAMRYLEFDGGRVGAGLAGEYTRGRGDSDYVVGPYFYYNRDTLDDMLNPSKGYSLNAQVWWNTADVWVSRTGLTAYVPWSVKRHFVLSFGLETGERGHNVYRAILGDQEELFSLARHPYVGDQAAWARVGVGRNFFNSWWGALRGEVFATYGIVMDDWDKTADAWEVGLALSVPGQFLNGKAVLVYDDRDEFTVGFSLGIPKWWQTPLP